MNKACSFFGHRNAKLTAEEYENLKNIIEDLIINKNVDEFLFGSRSNFDTMCHQIVTDFMSKYIHIQRFCYTAKCEGCVLESERERLEKTYSSILKEEIYLSGYEKEVIHKNKYTAGRAGYIERNFAMIDDSDFCIFYYDENYLPEKKHYSKRSIAFYQPKSGTNLAYIYAKQKQKTIINAKNYNNMLDKM